MRLFKKRPRLESHIKIHLEQNIEGAEGWVRNFDPEQVADMARRSYIAKRREALAQTRKGV